MCVCVDIYVCVCVGVCMWGSKCICTHIHTYILGFPDNSVGKESACNAGHPSLIPGLERSPGAGKGYSLQYSGLENSMECSPWGHRVRHN